MSAQVPVDELDGFFYDGDNTYSPNFNADSSAISDDVVYSTESSSSSSSSSYTTSSSAFSSSTLSSPAESIVGIDESDLWMDGLFEFNDSHFDW